MRLKTFIRLVTLLLIGCASPLCNQAVATTYTWLGTSGTTWGVNANWTSGATGTYPGAGDTAVINTSSTNQYVLYNLGTAGSLGTLSMTQTSSATNQLTLLQSLTVSNAITLGAGNGGSSIIYIDANNANASRTLTAPSLTLNSGGVLALTTFAASNVSAFSGPVNVSGGQIIVYSSTATTAAAQDSISGKLTMTGGTITIGAQLTGATSVNDPRLSIGDNATISAGVITTPSGAGQLIFSGSTNSISGLTATTSYIYILSLAGGTQTLTVNSTTGNGYIGTLLLRAGTSCIKTVGADSGTAAFSNVITMAQSTGSCTTAFQLSSDIVALGLNGGYAGTGTSSVNFVVDLNGHNFCATNTSGVSLNNPGANWKANWTLKNSGSGTNSFVASSINFSGAKQVDVGSNVILTATGIGANNLGTTGTIAANNVFNYIGSGTSYFTSYRAIGSMVVGNGTSASELVFSSSQETLQGNLTVNKNATLSLTDKTLTENGGAPGLGGLNGAGSIYNNGGTALAWGTANLILNTANANGSFSGNIGDHTWGYGIVTVSLTGGAGTQTFTGTNTYSGSTTISAGNSLALGDGTHDGVISSSSAINNNGTLKYYNIGTQTYAGTISGSGTVAMMGSGTQILSGNNTYTGATVISAGELDINGSLAAASAVTVKTGGTLGGSGTANGSVNVQSGHINGSGLNLGTTMFDGQSTISGTTTAASVTVNSGTTTASGAITSNGNLSIIAGATLKNTGTFSANIVNVANTAMLTNNGTVSGTVNVSGVLSGTGTVNGALTIKTNGELAPGNSPGTTTVAGNLTVETGAKISMQIEGTMLAGSDYDQIVVTGASSLVTLNAGSILSLAVADGVFTNGALTLIENQSDNAIVGTFSSVVIGGSTYDVSTTNKFTYNGTEYELLYNVNADGGTKANDFKLVVVPEPGTWAMLVGGLGMLLGVQWMRRRAE